jgi:hypothetical protein
MIVDPNLVLEAVDSEDEPLYEATAIPFNYTSMGAHIQVSGGANSFEMRKPWGDKKGKKKGRGGAYDDSDDDDTSLQNPEVYFSMAISCDKDPAKIIRRISHEWGKMGGIGSGSKTYHLSKQ